MLYRRASQHSDAQRTKKYVRDQAELEHLCGIRTMNSRDCKRELIKCQASPPSHNGERPLLAETLINTLPVWIDIQTEQV